ncbi:MAG: hypothetical protein QOK11_1993 [Pseudonocardiales bacterium]|nr:hypothetical protein [Pseudonocardiales bacterium]
MSTLDLIAAERLTLADVLGTLTPAQARTPSCCGDWTVHQVAGHLLMPLATPLSRFLGHLVAARGSFARANDRATRAFAERPLPQLAAGLRENARNPFHPPTFGHEAPLTELVVHGQDLRLPLGLPVRFPPEALVVALDMLAGRKARRAFVPAGLHQGLRFEASDVGWSAGTGALVRGPGAALAFAMTGRTQTLDELTGDGVAVLRAR